MRYYRLIHSCEWIEEPSHHRRFDSVPFDSIRGSKVYRNTSRMEQRLEQRLGLHCLAHRSGNKTGGRTWNRTSFLESHSNYHSSGNEARNASRLARACSHPRFLLKDARKAPRDRNY
mmetsp:Transcript_14008/g.29324  ORF Transcript_14008/g.29324 Transcript_14008/m.29324 type:complete len:117 (+) Transcript_14008:466-816(+)